MQKKLTTAPNSPTNRFETQRRSVHQSDGDVPRQDAADKTEKNKLKGRAGREYVSPDTQKE